MKDIRRLFRCCGPYRWDMLLGMLLVMIETGFELVIPMMIADLIDVGVGKPGRGTIFFSREYRWGSARCWPC